MSLLRALTVNRAATRPDAGDPALRGRTYSVPFARVWDAVLAEVERRRRWTLVDASPAAGEIRAEARTAVFGFTDDVTIRISLDPNGLTRVDMESASRVGRGDLGVNRRRIARFLHALDRHFQRKHS